MNAQELVNQISGIVARSGRSYSQWTIGITNDPNRRWGEHKADGKNVSQWQWGKADSAAVASQVEAYFIRQGMDGGTGGGEKGNPPDYVYVF